MLSETEVVEYVEEHKSKTWDDRIAEAEVIGYFTEEDAELASTFKTCAIGERFNLPIHQLNKQQQSAGIKFVFAVSLSSASHKPEYLYLAKCVYNEIQEM